jgi:hypothetical protein
MFFLDLAGQKDTIRILADLQAKYPESIVDGLFSFSNYGKRYGTYPDVFFAHAANDPDSGFVNSRCVTGPFGNAADVLGPHVFALAHMCHQDFLPVAQTCLTVFGQTSTNSWTSPSAQRRAGILQGHKPNSHI